MESADKLRRLRWQCRRGLLELDLLFTRFLEKRYDSLSSHDQESFKSLLNEPDPLLLAWVQGRESPPNELKNIIDIVIQ